MTNLNYEDRPYLEEWGFSKRLKDYCNGYMSTVIKPFNLSDMDYAVDDKIFVRFSNHPEVFNDSNS